MKHEDFIIKTGVQVSKQEFEIIEKFYYSIEANESEFIEAWIKMNPQKVKYSQTNKETARKIAKRNEANERTKSIAASIAFAKYEDITLQSDAEDYFDNWELDFIHNLGIKTDGNEVYTPKVSDVIYLLKYYIKKY